MKLRHLAPWLLLLGCTESSQSLPNFGAEYSPDMLDFGVVAVAGQRSLLLDVHNVGGQPYVLTGVRVLDDPRGKWQVQLPDALQDGLLPGARAQIEVTYRPCPEAWMQGTLDPAYDLAGCPTSADAGQLLIEASVNSGQVALLGSPGLPAQAELFCARTVGADGCPGPIETAAPCTALLFERIGLAKSCDVELEIVNRRQGGGVTADLLVEDISVKLRELQSGLPFEGARFEILSADGDPVSPSDTQPLVVSIAAGEDSGRLRLILRYTTLDEGVFSGDPSLGDGLRIKTSAEVNATLFAGIYGQAELPTISLSYSLPRGFFSTPIGQAARARFMVRNSGPGHAVFESVNIGGLEYSLETALSPGPLRESEELAFNVVYTPTDPARPNLSLNVQMQAPVVGPNYNVIINRGPICEITPAMLEMGTTSGGELTGAVRVRSLWAPCIIDHLEFVEQTPGAAPEFSIDLPGCENLPCDPGIVLCAEDDPACSDSEIEIPIRYRNQDSTQIDIAQLELHTSEAGGARSVQVTAHDSACLPPTPIINVSTARPCAGQPIRMDASQSLPGGPIGQATIVDWQWTIGFSQEQPEFMPPNAEFTALTVPNVGLMIINLQVTNSCGATSISPASEQFAVSGTCP